MEVFFSGTNNHMYAGLYCILICTTEEDLRSVVEMFDGSEASSYFKSLCFTLVKYKDLK